METPQLKHKRCPKCCTVKPACDFSPSRWKRDGLRSYCKACNIILVKSTPRELRKRYKRAHRERNRDKISLYNHLYHIQHRNKRHEQGKRWRQINGDKLLGYRLKDKLSGKQSERVMKRYALKRNAIRGSQKRVQGIYKRCAWWRQWFDVQVDHVIPLSFGGAHSTNNLQIIYRYENQRKHGNPFYAPQIIFL